MTMLNSQQPERFYRGGAVPVGYRAVDGVLIEDADEQAHIVAMVEARQRGMSLRMISKRLADRGFVLSHVGVARALAAAEARARDDATIQAPVNSTQQGMVILPTPENKPATVFHTASGYRRPGAIDPTTGRPIPWPVTNYPAPPKRTKTDKQLRAEGLEYLRARRAARRAQVKTAKGVKAP